MIRALTQVVFLHPYYRVNIALFVGLCQKLLLINEVEWVALCSRIYIGGAMVYWLWVIRIKYTLPIYCEFHVSLSAAAFRQENGLLARLTVRPCSSCVEVLWLLMWQYYHDYMSLLFHKLWIYWHATTHMVIKQRDVVEWHSWTGLSKKYRLHILDICFTWCCQGRMSSSWL